MLHGSAESAENCHIGRMFIATAAASYNRPKPLLHHLMETKSLAAFAEHPILSHWAM